MSRRRQPITISAFPAGGSGRTPPGRVRVAWMMRRGRTWRVEFEEGREFAAALAVMDHALAGGPFALDDFEAAMLAAQILDTAESKFRSISEHIAAALAPSARDHRQAA
ncbi:MAG: hypothetical protein GIKADHBN_01007 [Phycisphaerales bacterium]|nr:hypothetical protein [Phycisphaerales bacterium]MCK6476393.1 hypothetical protein [Phycisphaerales bacterium]